MSHYTRKPYNPRQMSQNWITNGLASLEQVQLVFTCHPFVVGHLVGRKWSFVQQFCSEYKQKFMHDISITYDGFAFYVRIIPFPPCVQFVVHEFGQRIYVANSGIQTNHAGAIIGKHGWWLRKTEQEQPVPCIIYHEDSKFYLKFPTHVSAQQRLDVLDNVRRKIMGRSQYFDFELADTYSTLSVETVEIDGPTPSEAYH